MAQTQEILAKFATLLLFPGYTHGETAAVREVVCIAWRCAVNLPPVHLGNVCDSLYTAEANEVLYRVKRY
jgi:hypothetical protein